MYVCVCVQEDNKADLSNPASNSSGTGSAAASSSNAGSPAAAGRPNTTASDYQHESQHSSPASIQLAVSSP